MKGLAVLTFQQLSQIHTPLTYKKSGQGGLEARTYILSDEMTKCMKQKKLFHYYTEQLLYYISIYNLDQNILATLFIPATSKSISSLVL